MTLAVVAVCLIVVALAALLALRMWQAHELALIAARPREASDGAALAKLEERVVALERAAAFTAGKRRRA